VNFHRFAVLICFSMFFLGCASLSKEQYVVCPYDTVWEAALTTMMKERPITVKDKAKGLIETGWVEGEGPERRFGLFRRAAWDNKERSSMTLTVKRLNEVTEISLTERRERWHLRGGATSQATRWWPIEPSEEAMADAINRINRKLKDEGCSLS